MERFNEIVKNKRIIIWDFDGTIVNLNIDWDNLKNDLQNLGYSHNLSFTETYLNHFLEILTENGLKEQAFQIINSYECKAPYKKIEKTLNIIDSLKNKIHCIFSDNLESTILRILEEIGMSDTFRVIISKNSVTQYKPNGQGLRKILQELNAEPVDALYIGDGWKDEKAAEECNIDFLKKKIEVMDKKMQVPFLNLKAQYNSIKGEIQEEINWVLENTSFVLGEKVKNFENNFASYCNKKYAIAVNSGTAALHLALLSNGVNSNHEVITIPNTFIATAEAISHAGAKPVFADIDETHNIDVFKIENKITPKTKAIMPVHLFGQPSNMDPIIRIAKEYNLKIIEDCCQAHGAEYNNIKVPISETGCFSFYPGKNLGAYGEGGIIVTDNEEIAKKCSALRAHGEYPKNTHSSVGYNYRMEGMQGAILNVKLKYLDEWNRKRIEKAELYNELLEELKGTINFPQKKPFYKHVYHLYVIKFGD